MRPLYFRGEFLRVHPPSWKLKCPGAQRSHFCPVTPGWQRHWPLSSQSNDFDPNELQWHGTQPWAPCMCKPDWEQREREGWGNKAVVIVMVRLCFETLSTNKVQIVLQSYDSTSHYLDIISRYFDITCYFEISSHYFNNLLLQHNHLFRDIKSLFWHNISLFQQLISKY